MNSKTHRRADGCGHPLTQPTDGKKRQTVKATSSKTHILSPRPAGGDPCAPRKEEGGIHCAQTVCGDAPHPHESQVKGQLGPL